MVYLGNESHCTETIIEFHPEKLTFVYFHHISIYRVSKQVWNSLNVASETKKYEKMYSVPKN